MSVSICTQRGFQNWHFFKTWNGMDWNVIEMNIIISGSTSDQNIGDIRFEVSSERPEERRIEPRPLN